VRDLSDGAVRPGLGASLARAALGAFPAGFVLVLAVVLAAAEGGYAPVAWYPAALLAGGALALVALAVPAPRPARWTAAAIGLLAAHAAWTYATIAWAGDRGAAWDAGGRALLYATAFATLALVPIASRAALALLGAAAVALAGIGALELASANAAADPFAALIDGGFAEPIGYQNGNAALWTLAALPALAIAAHARLAIVRGALLGVVVLLAGLGLLAQSRAWIVVAPAGALALVALSPARLRLAAPLALLAGAVAAMRGPALAVYDALEAPARADELLAEATRAIAGASIVAGLAMTAFAFAEPAIEKHWRRRPVRGRRGAPSGGRRRRAVAIVVAAAVAAVPLAALAASELPGAWREFAAGHERRGSGGDLSSLGSNRADLWRVAWEAFLEAPAGGIGGDNYLAEYLRRGDTTEEPRHPHSLPLRALAQTGIVGALLLAGLLLAAALALRRSPRLRRPEGAVLVAVAGASAVYYGLHGAVDWLWEIPAVTLLALAPVALALAPEPPAGRVPLVAGPRGWAALAVAAVAAAAALIPPYAAHLDMHEARSSWRAQPASAFAHVDRAARRNPVSAEPLLLEGTIAVQRGDSPRAAGAFAQALERRPDVAYALLQLAALASERGDERTAERLLARAAAAAPRDATIARARLRVAGGHRLDARGISAELEKRARERVIFQG
jgi:tetratricopeptide (TPR) repeat protein